MAKRSHAKPLVVLIDTNIVLDVLLARAPWAVDAASLLDRCAKRDVRGFVASHTITTVHYLVERAIDRRAATTAVHDLLELVDVVPVDADDMRRALAMHLADFEDAVQVAAFLKIGADVLVTRNAKDFRTAKIQTRTAGEVVARVAVTRS